MNRYEPFHQSDSACRRDADLRTHLAGWQLVESTTVRAEGEAQAQEEQGLSKQTQAEADKKSVGCLTCHNPDRKSMHASFERAGCTDCHGGNAVAGPGTRQGLAAVQ